MAIDKIFNNRYKTGDLDFTEFKQMKVDTDLLSKFGLGTGMINSEVMKKLDIELYEIHENGPYFERFRSDTEKVKKDETIEIFFYYLERLDVPESYSAMEKFIGIAEFLSMDYKVLYRGIGIPFQSDLLRDIDKKFTYLQKNKVNKLF